MSGREHRGPFRKCIYKNQKIPIAKLTTLDFQDVNLSAHTWSLSGVLGVGDGIGYLTGLAAAYQILYNLVSIFYFYFGIPQHVRRLMIPHVGGAAYSAQALKAQLLGQCDLTDGRSPPSSQALCHGEGFYPCHIFPVVFWFIQ